MINRLRWTKLWMVAFVALVGCASSRAGAGGTTTSAEEHREQAVKLAAQASAETRPAAPPNLSVTPTGDPQGFYSPVNKSPAVDDPARAERLSRHAQEHLAIAAGLDAFETDACRNIPASERNACPLLGPVMALDDVPGGIRVRFPAGAHVDEIAAEMRCHLAYARARGFQEAASCPLYVRGVVVTRDGGPGTVDLVSKDGKVAAEIRRRAREEATVVRAGDV